MKYMNIPQFLPPPRKLALIATAAAISFTSLVVQATPYATSLTNDAGNVSFRLNQATGTNDTVLVISSGGTVTNILQSPANNPANTINRGLVVTNLGIAAGTFQVRIIHIGGGVISTNGPTVEMGTVRGITVNNNTNSPYFGRVYVSNASTNTSGHGDGLFAFNSDMTDALGQGLNPKDGGYPGFGSSASWSPYRLSIAPDDSVLVADHSGGNNGDPGSNPNLIAMDPLLSSFTYVLKPNSVNIANGTNSVVPVGSTNNHGSIAHGVIVGTGANRKLFTMDEDYQQDPDLGSTYEMNSVWEYDIGNNPLPWSNAPTRIVAMPYLNSFVGQNEGIEYHEFPGGKHYLYYNQRRSNPPQYSIYIADLDNLPAPNTYGSSAPYGMFWDSQDESYAEGYSDDILRETMHMAISPDGRWYASLIAAAPPAYTLPDGSTFQNNANDIILIPITNGVPNLPARQLFRQGGASLGRALAFDAANNLYMGSSGLGYVRAFDIGESADVTTGSDGTFSFVVPSTQVSVSTPTPVASESGPTPGMFTITRTPDDIGNPLTVFFTITGTANPTNDYTVGGGTLITSSNCVIAAGQTSTNITITPIDDTVVEPVETVILTVKGSGGYSLGFPASGKVIIQDNEAPQLQILSLSTNVYQGNTNDYARLRIRRLGDTNVPVTLDASNFGFGGTATRNVDYYTPNLPFTIPAGAVDVTNLFIYPTPTGGSTGVGSLSILITNLAGTGYTVTNNTAVTTLLLRGVPPGTTLFSEDFESGGDSATNWNVFFGTYTNASTDFSLQFGYDYSLGDFSKLLPPIPAAPHSTNADTKGVYMTVNKNAGVAAALNLYLKNHAFSGSYALRFDMYLVRNSIGSAQSKVEDALFGINHDGTHTNWFRNAATGTSLLGSPTLSDGLLFDIGADGSGGAGANYDFAAWSGPSWTNTVSVIGPTNFLSVAASTMRDVFKLPPYDAGLTASGIPAGGSPGNTILSATPTWAEVEISQVMTPNGPLETFKVNNTLIISYYNTNTTIGPGSSTTFTNGTVMLGYDDPWDDLGNGGVGQGEGSVIFDNIRVVSITPLTIITQPHNIAAAAGTITNLSIEVQTSTGTTNYQWQHAGTNLPGAVSATLPLSPVTLASYGTYQCIVSDGAYPIGSAIVTVTPSAGPSILTQPVSRAALQGSTLIPAFSVVASTSTGVTNYQWYTNTPPGGVFVGRTSRNLNITNVQSANIRSYFVTVSDGFTTPPLTSSVVALSFAVPQTITNSVLGSTLNLSFGSQVGPGYVVEYKTNLLDAAWTALSTNAGTGSAITVSDSLVAAPTRFYRVRLQ